MESSQNTPELMGPQEILTCLQLALNAVTGLSAIQTNVYVRTLLRFNDIQLNVPGMVHL